MLLYLIFRSDSAGYSPGTRPLTTATPVGIGTVPTLRCAAAGLFFVWSKTFRVVRVLRLLTHSEGPRRVVMALVAAFPMLTGILVLILLLWFPSAVIGINLFQGLFWTCSSKPFFQPDAVLSFGKADCPAHWVRMVPSFDNFFTALRTSHILSTGSAWPGIMWAAVDRVAPEGPLVRSVLL